MFSWIYVCLASDGTASHGSKGKKKAQKSSPGILCYICVQNRVCREEMEPGAIAGRERDGMEEQTNPGEQDMKGKEQAVKKTNIKERSL